LHSAQLFSSLKRERIPDDLRHALRIVKIFEPDLIREFREAKEEGDEEVVRELIQEIVESAKHYEREATEFLKRQDRKLFKKLMDAREEEDWRLYNDILFDALMRLREAIEREEEAEERERFEGEEEREREGWDEEEEEREKRRHRGEEPEEEGEERELHHKRIREALKILREFDPEFIERLEEVESEELRERMLREAVMRARELMELKEHDPHMFELLLVERKLKRRIEEVTHRYHSTDNEGHREELKRELAGLLEKLFDVKIRQQAHQIERLAKELEHLRKIHQKHKENRKRIIERRLKELLGEEREEDFDW